MLIKHTIEGHLTYNYVGVHIRIEKYVIIIICKLNACMMHAKSIFDTYKRNKNKTLITLKL